MVLLRALLVDRDDTILDSDRIINSLSDLIPYD
jgi:hypothetical protein